VESINALNGWFPIDEDAMTLGKSGIAVDRIDNRELSSQSPEKSSGRIIDKYL